jgi:hypothetical protein
MKRTLPACRPASVGRIREDPRGSTDRIGTDAPIDLDKQMRVVGNEYEISLEVHGRSSRHLQQ